MPDGVLTALAARDDLGDFLELVAGDDLPQAEVPVRFRHDKDHLGDSRDGFQHTEGMNKDGDSSEGQKLLRNGASHAGALPGGGNDRNGTISHARPGVPPVPSLP